MNLARKSLRSLVLFLLSLLVGTGIALLTVSFIVTNPDRIKSWPSEAGTYGAILENIPDLIALEDKQDNKTTLGQEIESSGLELAGFNDAFEQGISAEYLQEQFEGVVDGFYLWLNGQAPAPRFKVDLAGRVKSLNKSLAKELKAQLNGLPRCTPAQAASVQSDDLFTLDCRPAELTNSEIDRAVREQTKGLKDAEFTGQDVELNDSVARLPEAFSALNNAKWLVPLLVVLLAGVAVALTQPRRRVARDLGWLFTGAGFVPTIVFSIMAQGSSLNIADQLGKSEGMPAATQAALSEVVTPLVTTIVGDVARTGQMLAGAVLLIGLVLLAVYFITDRKQKKAEKPAEKPEAEPKPVEESLVEAEPAPKPAAKPKPKKIDL